MQRSLPSVCARKMAAAISTRVRPLRPSARCGVSSVIGPSDGPYTYMLSANTSLAPAAAAPSSTAAVSGGNNSGHFV